MDQPQQSTSIVTQNSIVEFDPEMLDRMDYFVAQLKKQGIFVKLSANFTIKLGPGDKKAVPEIRAAAENSDGVLKDLLQEPADEIERAQP